MRQAIILGITALLAAPFGHAAAEVYRWVDEDGVVHYSDQPHPGAEKLRIESAPAPGTRLPANAVAERRGTEQAQDEQSSDPSFSYQSLTISHPAAEETLWNIGATLSVTLELQPALRPGHRVRVYFDGEAREVGGTQFTLDDVYRGVHILQAEVVDVNGYVMIRSQPNRFYVQQTTVVNPRGG
jgi:hypothetical protein